MAHKTYRNKKRIAIVCLVTCVFSYLLFSQATAYSQQQKRKSYTYQEYIDFFKEVYKVMEKNYYKDVSRRDFAKFVIKFKRNIYTKLKNSRKSADFIKWRSAAYLVDYLKDPDDTFSAFMPPAPAVEFEQKVLGKKLDLGIDGKLVKKGYLVTFIEPRCDAFEKGMRENDIILKINDNVAKRLTEEEIKELLNPEADSLTAITFYDDSERKKKTIDVLSKEYFKQAMFSCDVDVPGIYCIDFRSFNRKTSEDMYRLLSEIEDTKNSGLILDLRNNPGGPPLAAAEILSFFLPVGDDLAYFKRKEQPKSMLRVHDIPLKYKFEGPIAILVNEGSGSSSELFSGILQRRERAVLIGKNTAGAVLLKSMYHFDDGSMVLLVTAVGRFPDGKYFDFDGLSPDYRIEEGNVDMIKFAAEYLLSQINGEEEQ